MKNGPSGYRAIEIGIMTLVLIGVGYTFIPNFTRADNEENLMTMIDMLHQIRSQIDIYKAHSNDVPDPNSEVEFLIALNKYPSRPAPCMNRLPVNPFNRLNTIRIDTNSEEVSGFYGWYYNPTTGQFRADNCPSHANL